MVECIRTKQPCIALWCVAPSPREGLPLSSNVHMIHGHVLRAENVHMNQKEDNIHIGTGPSKGRYIQPYIHDINLQNIHRDTDTHTYIYTHTYTHTLPLPTNIFACKEAHILYMVWYTFLAQPARRS